MHSGTCGYNPPVSMSNVCHLFDQLAGWEQRVAVSQLLDRMPSKYPSVALAAIDPAAQKALIGIGRPMKILGRTLPPPLSLVSGMCSAVLLGRVLSQKRIGVLHAWGIDAAFSALTALRGRRNVKAALVLELFDSGLSRRDIHLLRNASNAVRMAVVCASQGVRRRLIEGGIPPDHCAVIRPGVDFGLLNHWRRSDLRRQLGVSSDETAIILPEPATRRHGFVDAFFAGALLHKLNGKFRVIVPGQTREAVRIARFADSLPQPEVLIAPGDRYPFEQLLAVSDILVMPLRENPRSSTTSRVRASRPTSRNEAGLSTTAMAWSMAAGVPVVGSATFTVTELVAHKLNGLLFKPVRGRSMSAAIANLVRDRDSLERAKEAARGQAYEVFGVRRFVDQHVRVYENLLDGRAPHDGIADSASIPVN